MDISTANVLLSGLMGFFGGLVTIQINAIFALWLRRDELKYAHKLDVTWMPRATASRSG